MRHIAVLCSLYLLLTGCTLAPLPFLPTATPTMPPTVTPLPSDTPTPTAVPVPWTDETAVMYGICFEAALERVGNVVALKSADEHIAFYNSVDASGACRRPITRNPFEFQGGQRWLVGTWSFGTGCTAEHVIENYSQQDGVLALSVRFVTDGDCPYELVRPFWIGVQDAEDVQLTLITEPEP